MTQKIFPKMTVLMLVVFISACTKKVSQPATLFYPRVVEFDCPGSDIGQVKTRCGKVYIDANQPKIYVSFALLTPENTPADISNPSIPVLYLSGGPGEGGNTLQAKLDLWRYRMIDWQMDRSLILWDSRGNQGAWGYFECEPFRQHQLAQLASPELVQQGLLDTEETVAQRCLNRWQEQINNTGFQQFSSEQNAKDAVAMLQALGFKQWHLLATSYGSRVARWITSLTPGATQSLVLDSPYSWSMRTKILHIRQWAEVLGPHFQAESNLLERTLKSLSQQPVPVKLRIDGLYYTVVIDHIQWLHLYFSALYSPGTTPEWRDAMTAYLSDDNPSLMTRLAAERLEVSLHREANPWLYWLTECNDNTHIAQDEYRQELQLIDAELQQIGSEFEQIGGLPQFWTWGLESSLCGMSGTRSEAAPPDMPEIAIPEILLFGLRDPVVPKPNIVHHSQLVLVADAGHGLISSLGCGEHFFTHFWHRPEVWVAEQKALSSSRIGFTTSANNTEMQNNHCVVNVMRDENIHFPSPD